MNDHTFVSMYTGAGGLDIGFMSAGFIPIFSNDINYDAMKTYASAVKLIEARKGGCDAPHRIVVGDIRSAPSLPEPDSAELVIGGPPCQGFSVAGKMDPNDPRSRHVFDFLAMVERVKPRAFVMENVKALARNSRWADTMKRIRDEATRIGYSTTLNVLNASDFGVPQARERMFLMGVRGTKPLPPIVPSPNLQTITVRNALKELPRIGDPGNDQICTAKVTCAKKPVLRKSPWAGMLFNGQGRPMDLDAPAPTLPASMGGNRTPIIDQVSLETGRDSWVIGYHASLTKGAAPAESVPERMRRISVDEAARLQSFPFDMPWFGSRSSRYKQIGNAVPPLLARAVANHIVETMKISLSGDEAILKHLSIE